MACAKPTSARAWRRPGSVQFGAHAVFLVQVVQVPGGAAVPAPGLAPRCGQSVGAFDAVDVVAFQRGVHAVGGVVQGGGDPAAPADPWPGGQGAGEPGGGSEAAADGG